MLMYLIVGMAVVLCLGYFFLMFFFPEWVGISGEDTKKTIDSHQAETPPDDTNNKS